LIRSLLSFLTEMTEFFFSVLIIFWPQE